MKKRLISLLLAAVMLLSLLPVTALADMIPDLTAEELAYNASLMQRRLEQCEEDTYGVRQFWLEHDGANEISTLAIRNIGGKKLKFWGYGYPLTAHDGIQVEDDFEVEFYQLNLVGDLTVIPGSSSTGILGYVALTSFGQVHGDIINTGAGTVSIQEGTFYGALRNTGSGRIAVQGGTFYQKPDESFLPSGYRLLERTDEKGVTYWDAKPLFYAMDIFGAGSMEPGGNNTLGGEYRSILSDESVDRFDPSRMKARFMGFATEVRFGYPKTFMLEGPGACTRELTLYSDVDLDPEKLNVSTLHQFQPVKPTLVEPFTKGVFGDDGGELYYYTATVSFPASADNPMLEMEVFYDDMPIFNTYIVHTAPFANYNMSYLTAMNLRMDSRADGSYGWMVPYGWWKVRYEKEGYLPTESKIMQVPPEHTAVNIGMLSTQAPYLSVSREDDGSYTVLFTKYMQLESLVRLAGVTDEGDVGVGSQGAAYTDDSFDSSTFAIRFFDATGNPVFGTVTFPDKAANTGYKGDGSGIYTGENGYATDFIASDWFVRKAVFTPSDPTVAIDLSRTTFASGIVSYAGVALPDSPIKSVYEIRFDANGGAFATGSAQTDDYGKLSGLYDLSGQPTTAFTPTREGYDFDGWYTAAQGGAKVSNDTAYFKNTTLYAHWTAQVPPLAASFCDDQDGGWLLLLNGLARLDPSDAVVLASYDDSGKMLSVKNYTKGQFDDVDGTGRLTVTKPAGATVVKAFLLSGGAYTPIRKPAIWNAE